MDTQGAPSRLLPSLLDRSARYEGHALSSRCMCTYRHSDPGTRKPAMHLSNSIKRLRACCVQAKPADKGGAKRADQGAQQARV